MHRSKVPSLFDHLVGNHENPSLMRVRTMISPSSIWPRWAAT